MWGVAALIGAVAFAALVVLMAVPLLKLGRTLDEATLTLRAARETPGGHAGASAPVEIARFLVERSSVAPAAPAPAVLPAGETVPDTSARTVASPPLGAVVSSTLGDTLIKAAAYGHGVRTSVRKRLEPAPSRPVKRRR